MNRQILRLAIPFIISNITVPLLGTVDTALMGRLGSTAHLGAIGLGSAIFNFLYWNFAFIKMSTVGMTAQQYGAGNESEVAGLLGKSMFVSMIGAILLIALQVPISMLAFKLLDGEADVESYARQYYYIRIWAAPATIGLSTLTGWFIGVQNARIPMFTSILVNLINISLSFYLVALVNMKSTGVAIGTVVAQYIGFIFGLIVLFKKYPQYIKLINFKKLINFEGFKEFFRVNLDVFIRTLAVITVLTWYNFASAGKGRVILGVNVIFLQLVYAFSFFMDGFSNAAEALVGKFFGEINIKKLKEVVQNLFYWGFGIAFAFTLLYMFALEPIIRIYSVDVSVIQAAKEYKVWIVILPFVSILTFIWDGIYLGATATRSQRNVTIIAAILFFVTYHFLTPILGNHALLFAQLVFFGMRGILQSFFYKSAILNRIKITENDNHTI